MGIAVSSLIMQNTLLYFLTQLVTGPDREDVIHPEPTRDLD